MPVRPGTHIAVHVVPFERFAQLSGQLPPPVTAAVGFLRHAVYSNQPIYVRGVLSQPTLPMPTNQHATQASNQQAAGPDLSCSTIY
jgi:hypothetical protein